MHKATAAALIGIAGVITAAVAISSCAPSTDSESPPRVMKPGQPDPSVSASGTIPYESWSSVEQAALRALEDDAHTKAARYEIDRNTIVITVHTQGDRLSASELEDYAERVRQAVPDVHVVIHTTVKPPPRTY